MKSVQRITAAGLFAASIALAGCGNGGPSSNEVREIIEAEHRKSAELMNRLAGSRLSSTISDNLTKLNDVDVVGCEEVQQRIYRCVLDIEMSLRGKSQKQTVIQMFVKDGSGNWAATN